MNPEIIIHLTTLAVLLVGAPVAAYRINSDRGRS